MQRITGDTGKNIFTLHGNSSSYSLQLYSRRYPLHLHWGSNCCPGGGNGHSEHPVLTELPYSVNPDPDLPEFFPEAQHFEFGWPEEGDYRRPAFSVRDSNGFPVPGPGRVWGDILWKKPELPGLPEARCEEGELTETLLITMEEHLSGLRILIRYTPLPEYDAVLRSARFENRGSEALTLDRAMSCSLDLPYRGQELLYLRGAWAKERIPQHIAVEPGCHAIGSTRGISSHQYSPFLALLSPDATEHSGEVWGCALIYSGSFLAEIERDYCDTLRLNLGIHPDTFRWQLAPGEIFDTPETVMFYSPEGLEGFSDRSHRFIRDRILPPAFRERERPILFNNWEATYFDFDEERLQGLADTASELGIELFVVDDGWFGERNSDAASLGDWQVNRRKLPGGLGGIGEYARERGMQFGLWVEPEMVSRESELFRRHPDWCLHLPGRQAPESRRQLVLDLTRREVREHLIRTFDELLDSAPISYVKWDMNRPLAGAASPALPPHRRGEVHHRYVLGLYEVMEAITSAHPDILFEGCAGGGGRFDMGMLYYMPQYWTSDNTDATDRLSIQYGTSIVFPPVTIGAHVSAVPNHQTGRSVPLDFRGNTAMSGNLGYEMEIDALSQQERADIARQIAFYKEHRRLIQFGRFIRLLSPFEGEGAAWMFVDEQQSGALVFWFLAHREANRMRRRLLLRGLDLQRVYAEVESGRRCRGDELMHRGLLLPPAAHDFESVRILLKGE